jgi:DNA-binding transcriptional LysR family regulator
MPVCKANCSFAVFVCSIAMLEWNDLRYVLAIGRAESLAGAAAALAINHSTVFRRLNAIEGELGVKLFERRASGYLATEAGERLVAAAERMEAEALGADRELSGRDARLSGRLRVTSSETLAYRFLTQEIARFARIHPGIQVELTIDNRQLDLSRRETDVALRAARPAEGGLFGRKLADIPWAFYGAKAYLARRRSPKTMKQLAGHAIIGWADAPPSVQAANWLAKNLPEQAIVYRTSSLINQLVAAKSGIGLALLPCYLAEAEAGLTRVSAPIEGLLPELWMITHDSLKNTARVRAFMELAGEGIRRRLRNATWRAPTKR